MLVAHAGQEPCGFVLLHPRGVGALLLARAEAHFAASARHIFLCVSSFNERARRLYERHGYAAVGELKDYIVEGASETLMHKRLAQP